jgi:hypothetical protein
MNYDCTLDHGGCYRYIMGQNHKILLKNRQLLEKMYIHFIFTSVLNPYESSCDKCHRLSFFMSQTRFVCSIGHFGANTTDFVCKSVKHLQGSKY